MDFGEREIQAVLNISTCVVADGDMIDNMCCCISPKYAVWPGMVAGNHTLFIIAVSYTLIW
jgi:hypothetical protein